MKDRRRASQPAVGSLKFPGEREQAPLARPEIQKLMTEEEKIVFLSAEEVARMLSDAAEGLTTTEYTRMLEDVLGDVESDVVASIAEHMSPDLQILLPRKYLH
jgi:hypothetical protein